MTAAVIVHIPSNILDTIFAGAKELYPRESFLLLRGKKSKGIISVTDLVLAPFAAHEEGAVHFNPYMFAGDYLYCWNRPFPSIRQQFAKRHRFELFLRPHTK